MHQEVTVDVERFFQAMGTETHLRVLGDDSDLLLASAEVRLAELEARWDRTLPESDVARANAAEGEPTKVTAETAEAFDLARQAWVVTGGRYDASVAPVLVGAGRARVGERPDGAAANGAPGAGRPGLKGLRVDRAQHTVVMPPGTEVDLLDGIGLGRAADMVAEELLAAGATGACVNVGGDVRVAGLGPAAGTWTVAVEHPLDGGDILTVALDEGAVATSTAVKSWSEAPDGAALQFVEPATGAPRGDLASVTVLASEASWAGVVARAALLSGAEHAADVVAHFGLTGLLVDADGTVWTLPGLDDYLA
jgi:FAD:protein FMN transferase